MEFISNLKKKHNASVQKGIETEAYNRYSIMEYAGSLFYAFDGVPAVAITAETTAKEIQAHLHSLQDNYIKYQSEYNKIGTRV